MKKLFIGIATLALTLTTIITLSSCSSGGVINFANGTTTTVETPVAVTSVDNDSNPTVTNAALQTPDYHNTSYTLTTTSVAESTATSSTAIVSEIVDACVSVTAKASYSTSAGSGVLFAEDTTLGLSYVVTCFHVVSGTTSFTITTDDGTDYPAQFVGGYEDEDLAVLSIKKTGLKYATLIEDTDKLLRGMDVICIGNPLGTLPNSVSKGIISYVNRTIAQNSYTNRTLIQTDVAINSGNSGGGLFSSSGALIGIVSNKYSSSSIDNLGFAIPVNTVKSTIESILGTAKYDTANELWQCGYVEGDYEYAFSFSIGTISTGFGFGSRSYVIYISDLESDTSYSGATTLQVNDIVKSITVKYADTSKTSSTYTVGTITNDTVTEMMLFLKNAELSIGDKLEFSITRNSEAKTVEFEIVQFVHTI